MFCHGMKKLVEFGGTTALKFSNFENKCESRPVYHVVLLKNFTDQSIMIDAQTKPNHLGRKLKFILR